MVEIERKYLIKKELWKPTGKGTTIKQGYLSITSKSVVRVRTAGQKAYLTIKGMRTGITRTELEYEIPKHEAEVLLKLCLNSAVEKIRYFEEIDELTWEIDVFEGENEGLIIAEVELTSEEQEIVLPEWIDREVSQDYRYFNSWLSQHPFKTW